MMQCERRIANALGGKTARACENCLRKRARWFCGADDAFLCQACDTSVHSANQLASRHERVRLETSSFKSAQLVKGGERSSSSTPPVWHQGFTRKARTPRHNNNKPLPNNNKKDVEQKVARVLNSLPLVPEIGSEESSLDENEEEQLLYRVPVFEPLFGAADQLCNDSTDQEGVDLMGGNELNFFLDDDDDIDTRGMELMASDAELAEFAADVESLLGTAALDDDSCGLKGEDSAGVVSNLLAGDKRSVKIEDEEVHAVIASHFDPALENSSARESFGWDYYLDHSAASPVNREEEDMKRKMKIGTPETNHDYEHKAAEAAAKMISSRISLKLNYEEVITAWDNSLLQGCPWINGTRPDFNPADNSWPDFLLGSSSVTYQQYPYGAAGGERSGGCRNEEREARVSRYREKRRTRLFSKKIRYEVRKLNAEKRPRMKGRFVKRTTVPFPGSSSNFPNNYLINNNNS